MLGILDWGIGGLGFYARLKEDRPDADIIYLSDSGATPYGRLDREGLRRRVALAVRFLASQGAAHVVVACNSASTVVPLLRNDFDFPVVSIIEQGIDMVRDRIKGEHGSRKLGIVGGERTVRSGIYQRALGTATLHVRGRVAQPLSALIEAGEWKGETFRRELERILQPLTRCDSLLLACTHYPAAAGSFREVLPSTELLDPVDQLLVHILRSLPLTSASRSDRFLTTGEAEAMKRAGLLAFGVEMEKVERISL